MPRVFFCRKPSLPPSLLPSQPGTLLDEGMHSLSLPALWHQHCGGRSLVRVRVQGLWVGLGRPLVVTEKEQDTVSRLFSGRPECSVSVCMLPPPGAPSTDREFHKIKLTQGTESVTPSYVNWLPWSFFLQDSCTLTLFPYVPPPSSNVPSSGWFSRGRGVRREEQVWWAGERGSSLRAKLRQLSTGGLT